MNAEVYIVDENGKRVTTKPTLIKPCDIQFNGISRSYRFEFEYLDLDEEAFDKFMKDGDRNG